MNTPIINLIYSFVVDLRLTYTNLLEIDFSRYYCLRAEKAKKSEVFQK